MTYDYDKIITEPKHDRADEYANLKVDKMETKEMLDFVLKNNLVNDELLEALQQRLYDYFYDEHERLTS